jgi:hypothetical protein
MARVRDGGRVPVEVELLNAVVAVGHDHGGSGCRAVSRAIQPPPKRRPIRVELDVGGFVRCTCPEHGRIISAPERGSSTQVSAGRFADALCQTGHRPTKNSISR